MTFLRKRRARARLAALQAETVARFEELTAEPIRELPDFHLPHPVRRRGVPLSTQRRHQMRSRG